MRAVVAWYANGMKTLAVVMLLAVAACTATEPGTPAREAWLTGKLTFRKVESEAPTSKPSSGYPAPQNKADDPAAQSARATRQSTDDTTRKQALDTFDCTAPDPLLGNDDAAAPLVTCDAGEFRYDLGPVFLDGGRITEATAGLSQYGGHVVTVEFDAEGAKTWGDFTTANVGRQVAILINGRVLSAPTVQGAITGGTAEISGKFTADEAEQLANQLSGR
ncbi:preprotein translocase subunit SecD [Lentzea waywayandensis]|uniref:Preprotein translocase subunit SecD n=1 Tax=Lentzea waywayandensis TaxID=84724 RepID=A0A1I6ERZ6_9PSEU|nr:precorrin-3B C(17)-methyltransferase [Lentzea waywayandensis]SFR20311.1 preprotein translocase subunit SecD [Lentzea waywayandensis]